MCVCVRVLKLSVDVDISVCVVVVPAWLLHCVVHYDLPAFLSKLYVTNRAFTAHSDLQCATFEFP